MTTKFHGLVEHIGPDNIPKTGSLQLQRLWTGVRVDLSIGASSVKGTSGRPMTTKLGGPIGLVKTKLTLATACRSVNTVGKYGGSKIFVGQALETGNGDRLSSLLTQTIEDDDI
jgi:hypothetical protein